MGEAFRLALRHRLLPPGTIACVTTSVLVIDDDTTFRELAVRMLARAGVSVVGEADSVATGVAAARKLRPGGALVDIALPDGSGVTLSGELAALPSGPRIVLTSSDAGAITQPVARSAGAVAFIAKHDLSGSRLRALFTTSGQQE